MNAYPFELYDAEPNDVARALAVLLYREVTRCPARAKTARRIPRPVVVHDTGTDTTATLACERDRATVYNDLAGRPSVIVRADTNLLRDVCRLPLTAGLPPVDGANGDKPATGGGPAAGRHILRELARRRIRVTGLLRHALIAAQFRSLLAPAE